MRLKSKKAFTLIEVVLTMLLLALFAGIGAVIVGENADASRFEQTRQHLEKIRQAIVGDTSLNPKSSRRTNFGFTGDWGGLPSAMSNLTTNPGSAYSFNSTYGFGAGWRGPYITSAISGIDSLKDAWDRALVLDVVASPATVTSYGSDGTAGATAGQTYSQDIVVQIPTRQWRATVRGRVLQGSSGLSGRTVVIRYPSGGTITSASVSSGGNGDFQFTNIPMGIRSIEVTAPVTLGPKQIIVDNPDYEVPLDTLNYLAPELNLDAMCCRLSLSSTDPVSPTDLTAQGTIYFLAFKGNHIPLYNTTEAVWKTHTLRSTISVAAPAVANTNFDVFVYDNAGTLALETANWSTNTARATALSNQDGVLVKSSNRSRRYLGTGRTVASGQVDDTTTKRFLWNHYHRVPRPLKVTDATASWVTLLAGWRSANGSNANRVEVVVGQSTALLHLTVSVRASDSGSNTHQIGIGEDQTAGSNANINGSSNGSTTRLLEGVLRKNPIEGYHYYQWVENGNAVTTTWVSGGLGITGTIEG